MQKNVLKYKMERDSLSKSEAISIAREILRFHHTHSDIIRGPKRFKSTHKCKITGYNFGTSNLYKTVNIGIEWLWPHNYVEHYILNLRVKPPKEFMSLVRSPAPVRERRKHYRN